MVLSLEEINHILEELHRKIQFYNEFGREANDSYMDKIREVLED